MQEDFKTKKEEFIQRWAELTVGWGANKAMGQIQALLLLSPNPICSQTIKDELDLSVGSINKATRTLSEWGLIHKTSIEGVRKDFFYAEKDIFQMFKVVIEQRMKKELTPMIGLLEDMKEIQPSCGTSKEFVGLMESMLHFSYSAQQALDKIASSQPKWIYNSYAKK